MTAASSPTRRKLLSVRLRLGLGATAYYVVALGIGLVFVLPLLWTVARSLQDPVSALDGVTLDALGSLSGDNYAELAGAGSGVLNYARNSAVVAVGTTVLTLLVSTMAGYALARTRFPGQSIVFVAMLVPLMVPFQGILLPLFTVLSWLRLTNSLLGLVLVYTTFMMPFSIFLMRNMFLAIPDEIEEAAIIDGAGTLQILRRIFLPLVVPGLATVALYAFLFGWSEFLAALIFISKDASVTLPVALANLQSGSYGRLDMGVLQAGAVTAMVPCVVLFIFLQRYYLQGLAAGAVKF